ncbi:IS110 family transposase, partial [Acidisoma silvae]|nr:IS110 family transposase [Acidisoma silvae]
MRQLVVDLRAEWEVPDDKFGALNAEFNAIARNVQAMCRFPIIPGIGVLNATALVAAIGTAESFSPARNLGACLELVPKQHSTAGKIRLLGITKRGNTY